LARKEPRIAIFHLTAKTGSRGSGQSAAAKAAYITREGKYARGSSELEHALSGHHPQWAESPSEYWAAADLHERANGRLFKEIQFALPIELSPSQRLELASAFAHQLTDGEKLPFTLALHAGKGENPHAHLMVSERANDGLARSSELWFKRYNAKAPEKGGAQKTEALKPKEWLESTRELWAKMANEALERAGLDARIDHRSLENQGLERLPGIHLGPKFMAMEERGIRTVRGDLVLAREAANLEIKEIQQYREILQDECDRQTPSREEPQRASGPDRAANPSVSEDIAGARSERGGPEKISQPDRASPEKSPGGAGEISKTTHRQPEQIHGEPQRTRAKPNDSIAYGEKSGFWDSLETLSGGVEYIRRHARSAYDRIVALVKPPSRDTTERDDLALPARGIESPKRGPNLGPNLPSDHFKEEEKEKKKDISKGWSR